MQIDGLLMSLKTRITKKSSKEMAEEKVWSR